MKQRLVAATAVVGLIAAACGDDGASSPSVEGAWARTSPMMADAGAVYFTISSDDAVAITDVSVPESIAGRAELHETVMVDMGDDDMGDNMDDEMGHDAMEGDMDDDMEDMDGEHDMSDMGGAMQMQEVEDIPVAADGSVAFEPGGLHVMLLELADPLEIGETFTVTLTLDDGSELDIEVEVRDEAP